ncbi:S26 family signal peptidase [Nocardioides sp. LML1-1-1.1]|uniref:S26 family signal peptidase n=1 Tax=Nocardioides sp. LML1-1-1.1 TaxID=3135248 RepID=UPI00342793AD
MSLRARGSSRWARWWTWTLLCLVIGFIAFYGVWRLDGGRWERVETPSMGTVAPVGTLLWVKPVPFESLRAGDFITFHPPGRPETTYSHRVLARNADGTLMTKGVISAPDPWRLTAKDVVGRVQMRWRGIGWLVAATPVLLIGSALVIGVRALAAPHWRGPVVIVLGSVVLTVAIMWLRPLVNAEQLAFAPAPDGGADATYVGTGLLPVRLAAHDGAEVVMRTGEIGHVHVSAADDHGRLRVTLSSAPPWWFWIALFSMCFAPALWCTATGAFATRRAERPAE